MMLTNQDYVYWCKTGLMLQATIGDYITHAHNCHVSLDRCMRKVSDECWNVLLFFRLINAIVPEDVNVGEKIKQIYLCTLVLTSIYFLNDERLSCTQSTDGPADTADTDTAECFITSELRLNSMALLAWGLFLSPTEAPRQTSSSSFCWFYHEVHGCWILIMVYSWPGGRRYESGALKEFYKTNKKKKCVEILEQLLLFILDSLAFMPFVLIWLNAVRFCVNLGKIQEISLYTLWMVWFFR